MKKIHSILILLCVYTFPLLANSATLLSDNFDNLSSVGDIAAGVNGWDATAAGDMTLETSGCYSGKCVKMSWIPSKLPYTWWGLGLDVNAPIIHIGFWFKYGGNTTFHSKFLKVFGTDPNDSTHFAQLTLNNGYKGWGMGAVIGEAHSDLGQGGFAARFDGLYPEWVDGDIVRNTGDMTGKTSWQYLEIVMKKNTAGNKDGYVKIWLNPANEEDYCFNLINLNFLPDSVDPPNWNYISFANYAPPDGSGSSAFENWYDEIVVTDTLDYIGPNGAPPPPATTYTLTVNKNGTGTGVVTSYPSGINCGGTCSASFDENSTPTLTFTADSGSIISSVSGCTLSGDQCTVSMGTSAKSVTATFDIQSGPISEFNWSSATYSVGEGDGNAIVGRINRTVDTAGSASVYWQTFGNTAISTQDYAGIYPTLVEFTDGETYKDVYLTILQDSISEETETLELRLSSPINGSLGSTYSAILSIVDDDGDSPVGVPWISYGSGYILD